MAKKNKTNGPVSAVIVAAGSGTRMGAGINKLLLQICGKRHFILYGKCF